MIQSFEEIKKAYPDEWLILGNPVMSEDGLQVLAADLLYHGADKRELAYRDKPLMKECKEYTIWYNGSTMRSKYVMAGGRTLTGTLKTLTDTPQPIKRVYQ